MAGWLGGCAGRRLAAAKPLPALVDISHGRVDCRRPCTGFGGADFISGGHGKNSVFGGAGDDQISDVGNGSLVYGGGGNDSVDMSYGHGKVFGGDGNDTITVIDVVLGSELYGGSGDDVLVGFFAAADGSTLSVWKGGNGKDSIYGLIGSDTIYGGNGVDLLYGGSPSDRLEPPNTFVFLSAQEMGTSQTGDVIADFRSGIDKVDFSAIGGLRFIDTATFSHTAGEVRYDSGLGQLQIDVNGDGHKDFFILISVVVAEDLIL